MLINFTDPMFSNRALGFENLVDRLERISNESQSSYPPYNIYRDGLKFQIEIAMKGIAAAQTLDDQEMDKFIKQYQDIKLVWKEFFLK